MPGPPPRTPYDAEAACEIIAAVRAGARLADLLRRPGYPSRRGLSRWRAARPDFAAMLDLARAERGGRPQDAWPYDPVLAGRLLERIAAGEMLQDLTREPGLPTRNAVRRWARSNPDFRGRLTAARRHGHRARRLAGRGCNDPAVVDAVCDALIYGASFREVAARPGMPSMTTLLTWLEQDPEFARAVALAREQGLQYLMDRALEIAEAATRATVRADRLRVSALRWRVSKLELKKAR